MLLIDETLSRLRLAALQVTAEAHAHSGDAPKQPLTVRRHTDVSFPSEVQTGKSCNLRIQLVPATSVLPSGEVCERPKPHVHDTTLDLIAPLPAPAGAPPPSLKLTVSVTAENFDVEGLAHAEIIVPFDGISSAVVFGLRGKEAGPGRIMIDFAQDGRPIGSVDLAPVVVDSDGALRRRDRSAPTSVELSLDLEAGPSTAAPDVVLKVFEHRLAGHPGRLQFVLSSTHPALADLPVLDGDLGTLDLRSEVSEWVNQQLRIIGTLTEQADSSAAEVGCTLASVGYNLYENLLPAAVQELSWTLRERGVKTLMVLSDAPHIPWELIKPFRADPISGAIVSQDGFWGESFALAHWVRGRPPTRRLRISRVMGVAASLSESGKGPVGRPGSPGSKFQVSPIRDMAKLSTSLSDTAVSAPDDTETGHATHERLAGVGAIATESAALPTVMSAEDSRSTPESVGSFDEELGVLRGLEAFGARIERLPALRQALRHAFEQGTFDLLHLVSHGTFGGLDAGDATAVYLDDGPFTAAELSPLMAASLRRAAPVVIFNTCHCGRTGFSLTRLGSWGGHLVRLGCGAFIGALWPVSDRAALAFARSSYEQLANRSRLGEAVRVARLRVREQFPDDPTWLAYCCFADPTAQFEPIERLENTSLPSELLERDLRR
jgi:hypothetical protein